jgi:hypothetical protein
MYNGPGGKDMPMTRKLLSVVVLTVAWFVTAGAQTLAVDPIDGTWRINPALSTYSPGPPPRPMGTQIRRFATLEDGWHLFELTSVTPEGDPVFQSVAFKTDGRQYPVYSSASLIPFMTTGKPSNITRTWRRIDTYTTEFTTYTNGIPGIPIIRAVSKDGKTYTETSRGKDAAGREVHNVVVFDRVR